MFHLKSSINCVTTSLLCLFCITYTFSQSVYISGELSPCTNSQYSYSVNNLPGTSHSYIWTVDYGTGSIVNGTTNSSIATVRWDLPGEGKVKLAYSYKDANNFTQYGTVTSSAINPINSFGYDAYASTNATTSCQGVPITLTANISGSVGQLTYAWTRSGSSVGSGKSINLAPPVGASTYSVLMTNKCGLNVSVSVNVNIYANPVVTTSAVSGIVCENQAANITANGASTYTWTSSLGQSYSGSSIYPVMSKTTTFTATGTDSRGCKSASNNITINVPTISISPINSSVCANATKTLTAAGADAGSVYSWSPANDVVSYVGTNKSGANIKPNNQSISASSTYTVTGTASGCLASTSASVKILSVPIAPTMVDINGNKDICLAANGQSRTYGTSNNFNDVSHQWSSTGIGNIISSSGSYVTVFYGPSVGSATIYSTASNQCGSSTGSITVYQDASVPSAPTATTSSPGSICVTSNPTSAFSTGSMTANSLWSISPASAGTINNIGPYGAAVATWSSNYTGNAAVQVRSYNGCGTSSFSQAINVSISGPSDLYVSGPVTACNNGPEIYFTPGSGMIDPTTIMWNQTPYAGVISNFGPYGKLKMVLSPSFTGTFNLQVKRNNSNCYSAPYIVTVSPGNCTADSPLGNNTISLGATVITGSVPTGVNGTVIYQWQSSFDNVSWSNVVPTSVGSATSKDFILPLNRRLNYVRRIVQNTGNSSSVASASVIVDPKTLKFNGSNQYAQVPNNASMNLGTGNLTMEAWFAAPAGQQDYPMLMSNRTSTLNGFLFCLSYTGRPFIQIAGNNFEANNSLCPDLRDDICHYIAISRNGSTLNYYVDGLLIDSYTSSWVPYAIQSAGVLNIGRDVPSSNNTKFKGNIDELRVWNVARTASEIQSKYRLRLTGTETGLVANWRMNEGSGQTLVNLKGSPEFNATLGSSVNTESIDPTWISLNCMNLSYRKEHVVNNSSTFDSTAIYNSDREYSLKSFPNPIFSGKLHFGHTASEYSISNVSGNVVLEGTNEDRLDVSILPKGIYMLKLDGKVEKIIVQ